MKTQLSNPEEIRAHIGAKPSFIDVSSSPELAQAVWFRLVELGMVPGHLDPACVPGSAIQNTGMFILDYGSYRGYNGKLFLSKFRTGRDTYLGNIRELTVRDLYFAPRPQDCTITITYGRDRLGRKYLTTEKTADEVAALCKADSKA